MLISTLSYGIEKHTLFEKTWQDMDNAQEIKMHSSQFSRQSHCYCEFSNGETKIIEQGSTDYSHLWIRVWSLCT